jgi:CBS domain-containing protein
METAAISYRVAAFLKAHPPFQAMEEADLVELAARGRVRFHEADDFVLWQGEPHKAHVFVIQQGTVSLWDESGGQPALRDIRGAGDLLGIERYTGAPNCPYSARATSDVVLYGFPAEDFEDLLQRYPGAGHYVAAHGGVAVEYQPTDGRREPQRVFLHDLVARKKLHTCGHGESIRDVARSITTTGADAIAVVDEDRRARAVVTAHDLLEWLADGGSDAGLPISSLLRVPVRTVAPHAAVTEGVLAMAAADGAALAITDDGTADGRLQAVVTARDVAPVFGDQPVAILREVGLARSLEELRALNLRARAFVLLHLTGTASFEWLARFTHAVDAGIVRRVIAFTSPSQPADACWCFAASSGRSESLTMLEPLVVAIGVAGADEGALRAQHRRVSQALAECGYLPRPSLPFEPDFWAAGSSEWKSRYRGWVRDPIVQQIHRARPLFDLRPIDGHQPLWREMVGTVDEAVDLDFVRILANDCLANLPPIAFFQDAVVEDTGEMAAVFRLERSALRPLVDVGRVLGLAGRRVLGSSTLERFDAARRVFPEHEAIFREAAETVRIVLWQQGRIGISQGTDGGELPPTLLSRHDRHMLKGGFRSILRLLEFAGEATWVLAP